MKKVSISINPENYKSGNSLLIQLKNQGYTEETHPIVFKNVSELDDTLEVASVLNEKGILSLDKLHSVQNDVEERLNKLI